MKKILIISYYFPPIKAIGGIRTYNFTKYLNNSGWNTTVLTTTAFKFLDSDNFFTKLKATKYVYLPTFDIQSIMTLLKPFRKTLKSNSCQNVKDINNTSFTQKLRNSFPFNVSYEGGVLYIMFGVLYSLYHLKKNRTKYLYSTFSPNTNHMIAYVIKVLYPSVFWVADFRDLPQGDSDTELFMKRFQLRLNKKIYSKADSIITVSEGLRNVLSKYNSNIHVINNGIDLDIDSWSPLKNKTENFNIVYTGSLYAGKRDAEILFKVVQELVYKKEIKEVRLIYAGRDGEIWNYWAQKYELEEYTVTHGSVNMEKVKMMQSDASINLMLTWATKDEKGILTGKFYEYLLYSKPIICIINGEKDLEIEQIFDSLDCGFVIYDEINKISDVLEKYYKQWQEKQFTNLKYNTNELEKYTSRYLTNMLEDIFLEYKV